MSWAVWKKFPIETRRLTISQSRKSNFLKCETHSQIARWPWFLIGCQKINFVIVLDNVLGRDSGCCPRRAERIAKRVLAISVTVTKRSSSLFRGKIATRKLWKREHLCNKSIDPWNRYSQYDKRAPKRFIEFRGKRLPRWINLHAAWNRACLYDYR